MNSRYVTIPLVVFALTASIGAPWAAAPAGASSKRGEERGKQVTIVIEGLAYKPPSVEIEPGDTVVWVNKDDQEHTVVADDGSFESGRIRSGKKYQRKFDKPGKYTYGDSLHPRMQGVIIVRAKRDRT